MEKRPRTNFILMFPFVLLFVASCMADETTTLTTNHEHKSSSTSAAISTHLGRSRSTFKPTGSSLASKMAITTGTSSPISTAEPSTFLSEVVTSTTKQHTISTTQPKTSTSVTKDETTTVTTNHEHKSSSTSAGITTHLGRSRSTFEPIGSTPTSKMATTTGFSSLISTEAEASPVLSMVVISTTKEDTTRTTQPETTTSVSKDETTILRTTDDHKSSNTSAGIATHIGHFRSTIEPTGSTPTRKMATANGTSSLISTADPFTFLTKVVTSTTKQHVSPMQPKTSISVTKGPLGTTAIILIIVVVAIAVVVIMCIVILNIQRESGEYKL